jgi:hypothetical protein
MGNPELIFSGTITLTKTALHIESLSNGGDDHRKVIKSPQFAETQPIGRTLRPYYLETDQGNFATVNQLM